MTQIVLIPGLMNDGWVWRHQIATLSRIAPIHIARTDGCDSLTDMAARIINATSGPLAIVGHSMGGRVALEVLAAAPERVTRLALVASGAQGVSPAEAEGRIRLVELARNKGMAAVADAWMPPMVGAAGKANGGLMSGLKAMLCRCAVEDFAAQQHALLNRQDRLPLLAGIDHPAIFVAGTEDPMSPPAFNREMAGMTPQGLAIEIADSGHMIPIEKPGEMTELLQRFLEDSPAR